MKAWITTNYRERGQVTIRFERFGSGFGSAPLQELVFYACASEELSGEIRSGRMSQNVSIMLTQNAAEVLKTLLEMQGYAVQPVEHKT